MNHNDVFDKMERGIRNCVMGKGFSFECKRCKSKWNFDQHLESFRKTSDGKNLLEMWVVVGLSYGFASEHADCELEE